MVGGSEMNPIATSYDLACAPSLGLRRWIPTEGRANLHYMSEKEQELSHMIADGQERGKKKGPESGLFRPRGQWWLSNQVVRATFGHARRLGRSRLPLEPLIHQL
jgi:hypothetical protein